MGKQIRKPYVVWIMFLASMIFISLIILRALRIPLTHDEAYTYLHYVKQSWLGIILYKPPHIPNNHILNTLLVKLSVNIFGLNDFSMRLPNILMAMVYYRYAAAIARKFRFPGIQLLAFFALGLQLYFIDFFGMARGYGMGLSLSLASIYHLYCYRELNNGHHIWRTLLFAAFAVYANFTFLYAYMALVALLLLLYWLEGDKQTKSLGILWRPVGIVTGVLALLIFLPLKNISGDLFGGNSSFWNDSIYGLSRILSYQQSSSVATAISYIIGLILLMGILFFILDHIRKKSEAGWYYYSELLLWLIFTAMAQIAQHYILGTEYLVGRTTMVYAPLTLCFTLFLFQRFNSYPKGEHVQLTLNLLLVASLAWNFKNFNLKQSVVWTYDASHKEMLKDLEASNAAKSADFNLGINWLFEPSLNYYRESKSMEWLPELSRSGYRDQNYAGYYLLNYKDQEMIAELKQASSNYKMVAEYENGAVLFLKKDYL
ncbi:MAG: hypothetical protein NXI09_07305 [Bacteroidetes bacterium]|nr:hypothetical protein [Bacteroidota bacterium]